MLRDRELAVDGVGAWAKAGAEQGRLTGGGEVAASIGKMKTKLGANGAGDFR